MNKLRLISLLCTIAMLIGCFAMFPAFAAEAETEVETPETVDEEGNGSGTAEDPYLIYVSNFADYYTNYDSTKKGYYSKHVKLMEDITVNEGNATEWAADATKRPTTTAPFGLWTGPMGGGEQPLTGSFDGNGHTISGVCIVGTTNNRRISLFAGITAGATVKNLKLTNSYFEMNGTGNWAEISSFASRFDGTISNCYSDAILVNNNTGTNSTATGGIVGSIINNENATIENCVFAGSITQTNANAGGNGRVGGILGYTSKANTSIKNCLFIGTIDAAMHVGAILGNVNENATTTVEGCMSVIKSGALKSSGQTVSDFYAGGINNSYVTVTSMYVVAGFTTGNVGSGGALSGVSGTWANIKQVTVNDLTTSETVASKLPDWNYISSRYIPNPTTIEGTDIKWTSLFKYWEEGDNTAGTWYTLDQDNFQAFWENNSSTLNGNYMLAGNITFNDGVSASDWAAGDNLPATTAEGYWTRAIGGTGDFKGTFDGNGYTISGIYMSTSARAGLFYNVAAGATVKNLRLTNSYFQSTATTGYVENGSITGRLAGNIANCYSDILLKNSSTDSSTSNRSTGGIAGMINSSTTARVDNCVFAGKILASYGPTGGIVGKINGGAGGTISDCLNVGSLCSSNNSYCGAIIGIHQGSTLTIENSMNVSSDFSDNDNSPSSLYGGWPANTITVTNFILINGTHNGSVGSGANIATGTSAGWDIKQYDISVLQTAEGVASKLPGWNFTSSKYIPDPSGIAKIQWTSGFKYWAEADGKGVAGKWYTLDQTNFHAFWAYNAANAGIINGSFALMSNVTFNAGLSASDWAAGNNLPATTAEGYWTCPIGGTSNFHGVFEGMGNTISGIYMKTSGNTQTGLFNRLYNGAVVKNVRIENSYFESEAAADNCEMGSIVGRLYFGCTVENCYSDAILSNKGTNAVQYASIGGIVGGILGSGDNPTASVKDCTFEGEINGSVGTAGGIVGYVHNNVTDAVIDGCTNNGSIDKVLVHTGGILGTANGVTTVSDCTNNGTITNTSGSTGGIVGWTLAATAVSDCINNGTITTNSGTHVSGILGYNANANTTVTGCVNNGNVTTAGSAGGIVGAGNQKVAISNCVNTGTVTSNADDKTLGNHVRPGGILGNNGAVGTTITDCLNTGTVVHTAGGKLSGGIVGNIGNNGKSGDEFVVYTATVKDCLNLSNEVQSGNLYAGGHTGAVVVTSFYRVKGLGINNYGSGADFATVTDEETGLWKNIQVISFAEFLNGTYLADWVPTDGLLPSPTAKAEIALIDYVNATTLGLDSTGNVHSIRISPTEPGLRFETKVDAAALAALEELGFTIEMKTYITLAAYASSVDFTAATLYDNGMPYLTVGATKYLRTEAEDGYTAFAGSVVNVKDITRVYAGIGCITLTIDGQSYDIYAKYDKGENASVSGVAFIAARDTKTERDEANGYTNQIVDIYNNTVYSPYNEAQYKAIKVLMVATPETAILNYGLNGNASYTASMSEVSANAVSEDEATGVYSDWTKWAAQGGCIVDGYIYTVMWSNNVSGKTNPNKCVIVKTNLSDGKVVAKSAALDLGHGNDLTFNGTDLVAVSCDPTKQVFFINPATLALDESRTKTLTVTPVSIDYDTVNNKYVVVDAQNTYVYIYDADFNLERTISGAGMTKGAYGTAVPDGSYSMQGIMTDGSYVYILGWHGGDTWAEEGSLSSLEHFFTSGVKSSIRVVDLASGAFVQDIDLGIEREVEFVDYENGTFYIGCNNSMWTGMEFYAGTIS